MEGNPEITPERSFFERMKKSLEKADKNNPEYENAQKLLKVGLYYLDKNNVLEIGQKIKENKIFCPIYVRSFSMLIETTFLGHTNTLKALEFLGFINLRMTEKDKMLHLETDFFIKNSMGWYITSVALYASMSANKKKGLVIGDSYRPIKIEEELLELI